MKILKQISICFALVIGMCFAHKSNAQCVTCTSTTIPASLTIGSAQRICITTATTISGTITINGGGQLCIQAPLTCSGIIIGAQAGVITNYSQLTVNGNISNKGSMYNKTSSTSITCTGNFSFNALNASCDNYGTITVGGDVNFNSRNTHIVNQPSSVLTVGNNLNHAAVDTYISNEGTVQVANNISIAGSGSYIKNVGTVTVGGSVTVQSSGVSIDNVDPGHTFTITGALNIISGTVNNSGTISSASVTLSTNTAAVNNYNQFSTGSVIVQVGTFTNQANGAFVVTTNFTTTGGTTSNYGNLQVGGTFINNSNLITTNAGAILVTGDLLNTSPGKITMLNLSTINCTNLNNTGIISGPGANNGCGVLYVSNTSTNSGNIVTYADICDQTPPATTIKIDSNTGTVDGTVTFCTCCNLITATITGPTSPVCEGEQVSLTVNPAGNSYVWSNGETTQTATFITSGSNPNPTYTVDANYGNGCVKTVSFTVTTKPTPKAAPLSDMVLCPNVHYYDGIRFDASPPGTIVTWNLSNPSIFWLDNGNNSGTGTGDIPSFWSNVFFDPAENNTSLLTYTPELNGCVGLTEEINITIEDLPRMDNFLSDINICPGATVGPIEFISSDPTVTFEWYNFGYDIGLGYAGVGNIPAFTAVNDQGATVAAYLQIVPVSAMCGAFSWGIFNSYLNVYVHIPDVMVSPSNSSVVLGNSITLTATGASNYLWTPASSLDNPTSSTVSASPTTTTNYTVTGTDDYGCTKDVTAEVFVITNPEIYINTKTINGYAYSVSGSGITAINFNTGNIETVVPQYPQYPGVYNTVYLHVAQSSINTDADYQIKLNYMGEIEELKQVYAGGLHNVSSRLYSISTDKKTITFYREGSKAEHLESLNKLKKLNISLKNGTVLTPLKTTNNVFTVSGSPTGETVLAEVKNLSGTSVFSTSDLLANPWDGKVGGAVVKGVYKFTLTIGTEIYNGQLIVSDEN